MKPAKIEQIEQIEQEIARLVSSVFIYLDECDHQIAKQFGLTTTQCWALVHLEDPQGRSLSELAILLNCDKSNVTSIVDRLEGASLAERKRGKAGDRRYTRVVLTEKGQQMRLQVKALREQTISTRLRPLGGEALQQLYGTLQQFDTLLAFSSSEANYQLSKSIQSNRTRS